MSGHNLCPSCGNCLGEVRDFVILSKQGYYKSLGTSVTSKNVDKIELCPNITKPIGFILDAAGLTNICCRMHIMGSTNFDSIYK